MKKYQIQVDIKSALVEFSVRANSLEDALAIGREELKTKLLFAKGITWIDSEGVEVSGIL